MTERLDPYGTWGDWDLDRFKVEVARWRDTTHPHPPDDAYALVDRWWQRLKQPAERTGAVPASDDDDPDGNLWWMWVPDAQWLDEQEGRFRVLCRFWVYELERPPRLKCKDFRTVQSMSPTGADRGDGMG